MTIDRQAAFGGFAVALPGEYSKWAQVVPWGKGQRAMADEPRNPFELGPYVQVAAFCERLLREADGVVSLIRVVDVITHQEGGTDPPREMPTFRYPLTLVLLLKSGRARGRHEITVEPELPSGERPGSMSVTVQMEGEGRGTHVGLQVDIPYSMEGLHWFNVKFDEIILTRLPLEVRYSRLTAGTATPPAPPQ